MTDTKAKDILKNVAFDVVFAAILWLLVAKDVLPPIAAVVFFSGPFTLTLAAMFARRPKPVEDDSTTK